MNKKFFVGLLISACMLLNANALANDQDQGEDTDAKARPRQKQAQKLSKAEQAYQLETINKLVLGYYHGAWKVCEILNKGKIVDNPTKVDRSIVVFNNKIYQYIEPYPLDELNAQRTTSLATIHGIDKPIETAIVALQGINSLSQRLGIELEKHDSTGSKFYIMQMQGEFSDIALQNIPDRNWVDEQIAGKSKSYPERKYQQLKGTVVGIRMIDYLKSNKSLIWYLHFVSEDKSISGMIVNINVNRATMKVSPISDFSIYIPVWTE